jgi:putative ABC transport system permease protein
MFVSVTERTKEIGLRKAVGAKPIDIRIQFLIEAVILSISGGIIALLIAWGGTTILNRFFPAHITWWSIILAFSISTLVGIIFGVAPAYKASKLDPIDALRYE